VGGNIDKPTRNFEALVRVAEHLSL